MPSPRTGALVSFASHLPPPADHTDAELLGRFVRHRDEAAFAAVVRRHGRAVLGVCRRILGNSADADDAFQATFLTLAKKAHRVAFRDDVSAWLFAVAVRAGREALRRRFRRANRETAGELPDVAALPEAFDPDVSRVVLDEVAKLSEAYRSAVVLCELDGVSRAAAAKQLGIAEGTLSSRLAAARRLLAARLTARGLTLAAVAPLATILPSALAAGTVAMAFTSDVPAPVLELTEALMRTSPPFSAGKLVTAVAVLAAVVVGGSFGDDPKPQPIQPAAAKVVVDKTETSRLTLTFREEVRYLTPTGRDLQRIDHEQAKAADPELLSGRVLVGGAGVKVERFLPSTGRAGPGGVIPLESHGTRLMTPGTPPKVAILNPTDHYDRVVAWSPNGRQFVGVTSEMDFFWGWTGFPAYRVDAVTGKREKLPLGTGHELIDVSPDGKFHLTYRHVPRPLSLPGFSQGGTEVSLLTREGKLLYEHPRESSSTGWGTGHRLSPDGSRSVACYKARTKDSDKWQHSIAIYDYPPGRPKTTTVQFNAINPFDVECLGVAWSPDGKQIVSCWRPESWKGKQTWHVVVCDADGKNLRTVSTFEMKADEQIRSVDWW
ncbi:sigma-70 family RNA polymerase sigma factor [Limnoglobus roseus]|uniref:RNA polymerase subunit sigma n=1 Tax=Limnoglobus roseus TaxID=2598579 RepID=A0A5C1AB83_9BACT|nr:sigma-70 family RNA polymerase sigma factor [Limnoglobus roseus]QEL14288.1 RNA polymerase subunit sigma [Limnoglobus roseus]